MVSAYLDSLVLVHWLFSMTAHSRHDPTSINGTDVSGSRDAPPTNASGWGMSNGSEFSPLTNLRRGQNTESMLELPLLELVLSILESVLSVLAFAERGLPACRGRTTERPLRGCARCETVLCKRYVGASRVERQSPSPLDSTAVDM